MPLPEHHDGDTKTTSIELLQKSTSFNVLSLIERNAEFEAAHLRGTRLVGLATHAPPYAIDPLWCDDTDQRLIFIPCNIGLMMNIDCDAHKQGGDVGLGRLVRVDNRIGSGGFMGVSVRPVLSAAGEHVGDIHASNVDRSMLWRFFFGSRWYVARHRTGVMVHGSNSFEAAVTELMAYHRTADKTDARRQDIEPTIATTNPAVSSVASTARS